MASATSLSETTFKPTAQSDPDDAPDEACMARIVLGDSAAFATLHDRYGRIAYALAARMVRDQQAAEDIVQDVFLSLWRLAGRFDATRGSVKTYILSMTHHRAVDVVRGMRLDHKADEHEAVALHDLPDKLNIEHEVLRCIEAKKLRAALSVLSEEQRTAVELAYFGGYSHAEIAAMLQIPLGTVKSRLRIALGKLCTAPEIASMAT